MIPTSRSIASRNLLPIACRASDTTVTRKHHHAIEPQKTPPTVVSAIVDENAPRGASVVNNAANMMIVCGLVSVSSKELA